VTSVSRLNIGFPLRAFGWFVLAGIAAGASAAPVDPGIAQFKPFVVKGVGESLASARKMRDSIAAHDLQGAQQAWLGARAGWEQAEVITDEFFPDLDDAIDSWPNGKTGFHSIEARLFGAHETDSLAQADELVKNLTYFDEKLKSVTLTQQGLLNGLTKLAYEVGENKADGGESQFAGTSLADMIANVDGIRTAYKYVFAARLKSKDPVLAATAEKDIAQLGAVLKAPDLKSLDADALLSDSEDLAATLQAAAAPLGLTKPALGD